MSVSPATEWVRRPQINETQRCLPQPGSACPAWSQDRPEVVTYPLLAFGQPSGHGRGHPAGSRRRCPFISATQCSGTFMSAGFNSGLVFPDPEPHRHPGVTPLPSSALASILHVQGTHVLSSASASRPWVPPTTLAQAGPCTLCPPCPRVALPKLGAWLQGSPCLCVADAGTS